MSESRLNVLEGFDKPEREHSDTAQLSSSIHILFHTIYNIFASISKVQLDRFEKLAQYLLIYLLLFSNFAFD